MKLLAINCKPDLSYFTKRGLTFDITYKEINEKFPVRFVNEVTGEDGKLYRLQTPDVDKYLRDNYKTYDYAIIMVGWNPDDYPGMESYGYSYPNPIPCGSYWCTVRNDGYINMTAVHELHHVLCNILMFKFGLVDTVKDQMDRVFINSVEYPYYKNSDPEALDGNHARTWSTIKPYLNKLQGIKYNMGYKYFTEKEIVGLKPELVTMLDKARDIAGVPFKITSGIRTAEENAKLPNAVEDSAHLIGLACDVYCNDSSNRMKIISGALQAGFKRIGIGKTFVHLDCDLNKSQGVMWTYYQN